MDGQRFDAVALGLAVGASRRRVQAAVVGGLLAGRAAGEVLAGPCAAPNARCG